MAARDWVQILAQYRNPDAKRSYAELAISAVPFVALWALAAWIAQYSIIGALLVSVLNGLFLVRLFGIQHDCGHGSFLENRTASDWIGRILGVITLTPYAVWRRTHAIHHSHSGNLTNQGLGDITTLTVAEYRAKGWLGRFQYRLYRNPVVMFGLGPAYIFLVQNRVPRGLMDQRKYWLSAMGSNAVTTAALILIGWAVGPEALLYVFLPTTLVAATLGVWLFYVQHQFEETHWSRSDTWQVHDAALHGSSYYVMPRIAQWFTANIGIHHVHHLYSRIPFYRLPEVLRDHSELAQLGRITIPESLRCARLHLWDEATQRLVSFRDARRAA